MNARDLSSPAGRRARAAAIGLLLAALAAGCVSAPKPPPTAPAPAVEAAPAPPPEPAPSPPPPEPAPTPPPSPLDPDLEHLWQRYVQAVAAAKYPQPAAISRDLTPIVRWADDLVWSKQGTAVLMAMWTKRQHYDGTVGQPYDLPVAVWLSPVPQVRRFCREFTRHDPHDPEGLEMRLRQLLGLPPDADYDAFVEVWIDPGDFFRPCPDPETVDRECQVDLTPGTVDREAPCPWQAALEHQVSGTWVAVSQAHLEWMCANWQKSYPAGEPRKSYPWTALGYTYDWGEQADPRGASEYVAPAGTRVVIHSVTATAEYCAAPD